MVFTFTIEIKSDWKKFTQEFSKIIDSPRNKQHQRVLCNETRRLPNETTKQFAVGMETLVPKTYSLNIHEKCKDGRNPNDDSFTSIAKNGNKESITSFLNPRIRFKF